MLAQAELRQGPVFQDRPYQTEAVHEIWDYFRQKAGNPLVAMPTGTGKSIVIARFLQSVYQQYPFQRIMLLTHVKELIQQNFEKLQMLWPFAPAGIYSSGLNSRVFNKPITFAGIASVARKPELFGHIDLIIIDECHLLSPNDQTMYRTFIAALKVRNPYLKVIGFTATPWRLGHGHLTDPYEDAKGILCEPLFSDVCFDITGLDAFNRLIAEGYLCPLVPKRTKLYLDTDTLHIRGGEFIEKEMQEAFGKEEITEAALREAIDIGHDRKHWLIFASGIDHADQIGQMLNYMGIPTGVVHSKRADRDETIARFRSGQLQAVVNNNVLTTGFDYPDIDMIVVLRATLSTVLWVQMLGRGTRPLYMPGFNLDDIGGRLAAIQASPKHNCLVLDYARNSLKLGPVNDPVVPRKKGSGGGDAPVKLCETCETYNHISLKYCGGHPFKTDMGCGAEFTFEVKFKETASTDDIISGEMPITKVMKVDHISYDPHVKVGSPPMIKVSYYCGYKAFSEYFCPQHENWAGRKSRSWWKQRTDLPFPAATAEAFEIIHQVKAPSHLRIWTNRKPFPEIMAFCYDGTAFGTEEPIADWAYPQIEVRKPKAGAPKAPSAPISAFTADLDDDVPF